MTARYLRLVAEALLSASSDNKKLMRDAVLESIDRICVTGTESGSGNDSVGNKTIISAMLPSIAMAISIPGLGRADFLTTISKFLICIEIQQHDEDSNTSSGKETGPSILVAPLIEAMQDRNSQVRLAAEDCLVSLLSTRAITQANIDRVIRDLQPAIRRSLAGPLTKITETVESKLTTKITKEIARRLLVIYTLYLVKPAYFIRKIILI